MLDRRERSGDLLAALLAMQESWFGDLRVAMPGIIQSFDPVKRTAVIQPALKAQQQGPDGTKDWVRMPLLLDCPVVFPGSSDHFLTFPLKAGDECIVLFADRCIDAWWQSGGEQTQAEIRMHDLSDGFCLPAALSQPKFAAVDTLAVSTYESRLTDRTGMYCVSIDARGLTRLVAGTAVVECDATNGRVKITGELWINGVRYLDHKHTDPQGGITGGVV